jgi:hypothetical protein
MTGSFKHYGHFTPDGTPSPIGSFMPRPVTNTVYLHRVHTPASYIPLNLLCIYISEGGAYSSSTRGG